MGDPWETWAYTGSCERTCSLISVRRSRLYAGKLPAKNYDWRIVPEKIMTEGIVPEKIVTEAMYMVKFSSWVFRVFMTTTKNETENKLTEASTSVSLSELRSLERDLIRQLSKSSSKPKF